MPNPAAPTDACDVAVIGAGGAGLLAGLAAARSGARTILYERMPKPARKVAISGGGRCNFTNSLPPREFVKHFGDPQVKHLGRALSAFSKDDLIEMLSRYGVEGQLERHYRLYTKSGRGQDVVDALVQEFQKAGGTLLTCVRVRDLKAEAGAFALALQLNAPAPGKQPDPKKAPQEALHRARAVVVCTGGLSYPATGSTGDGYEWARAFGHPVSVLKPALVGLQTEEEWPKHLTGLAWEDAAVTLRALDAPANAKPLAKERMEILLTHFGISGPAILDISNAYVRSGLERARLEIDFFPDQPREALDEELRARFQQSPGRTLSRALDGLLPTRLLEYFEHALGSEGNVPVARLPKALRFKILDGLKASRLTITGTRGMEFGEVTAGGLEWAEVDPSTMQSRRVPGLYFAGEILDVAGRCGGFNLQAAFSSGYLAGQEAAKFART